MTVNEAIARSREFYAEDASLEEQIRWLSEIEGTVWEEILKTHLPSPEPWQALSAADGERTLAVPAPYDMLYLYYLAMRNDLRLGEITRYSQSAALFAASYASFSEWYNRTHTPVGVEKIKL